MKRLAPLISAALVSVNLASAADRIAVVDVNKIYQDLPFTAAVKMEIEEEKDEVLRNPRVETFHKLFQELQTLRENIAVQTEAEDEEAMRNLGVRYDAKRVEFHAMHTKEINTKMVAAMRLTLNRITATAQVLAQEKGDDMVFDMSGETSTGVPGLAYFKNAADLTEEVLATLQLTDPATPPEPAPTTGFTHPSR